MAFVNAVWICAGHTAAELLRIRAEILGRSSSAAAAVALAAGDLLTVRRDQSAERFRLRSARGCS